MANNARTVFNLDNTEAYKYFRFEAVKDNEFQLAELQFCTVRPDIVDVVNPIFSGVTINAAAPTAVTSEDGKVTFVGQYSPFSITEANKDAILYVASGNKIGYAASARTLKSCRAHFWVKPNNGAGARAININWGDGESTGITTMNYTNLTNSDGWFTLDGRKLSTEPTQKGVYINNGRKIIVK